ncbi:MAG: sigma 54-interacting transcriptional regulator [Desulfobacterota bacterium]|nr:sigma 54-interacting transcriptional regulator [Thermodesulfobacteriota bacterium]
MHDFTGKDWQALALMKAIEEPLGADLLAMTATLSTRELQEFLRRGIEKGLVVIHQDGGITLAGDLPVDVSRRLSRINTKEHLNALVEKMRSLGQHESLGVRARLSLLVKAGRNHDAALLAEEAARKAVRSEHKPEALDLLETALALAAPHTGQPEWDPLFLAIANELCRLRLNLTRDIHGIPALLEQVYPVAERLGDVRTLTRCDLVMGLYKYVIGRTAEGFGLIESGLSQAEALGDEDIMAISAEFRGIYCYLQGMYKEAVDSFEAIVRLNSLKSGQAVPTFLPEHLASSSALGYCSALLGQYHRAIGVLDSHWRRSRMLKNDRNTCFFEALLGIVLIIMGRRAEAHAHLAAARKDAEENGNAAARHVVMKGLAYCSYFEGDLEEAYRITRDTAYTEAIGPQYNWPVTLEMLHAFDLKGYPPITSMGFEQEMDRVLAGPNIHLRGVALRLRALQARSREEDLEVVLSLLEASESDLLRTGDPIELAKTRAEMARVKLGQHDRAAARNFALMAWEGLGGYGQELFPDDLVPLLRIGVPNRSVSRGQELIDRFMDLMDEFVPSADREELLTRLVSAAARFFGAERGGLFWFSGPRDAARPVLRVSYNLERSEVFSESFRSTLGLVFKAFRNAEPLVMRAGDTRHAGGEAHRTLAVICLPIQVGGEVGGVLYMDNSYTDPGSEVLDREVVVRVTRHIGISMERIFHYTGMIAEDRSRALTGRAATEGGDEAVKILGGSPAMAALLAQADQASGTEATVLITGETGVGKELLARRVHDSSRRKAGPFIVVDLAAVPETLVESELFGHEKGAFTGADRQKSGRVELAHTGTLFIDEIGDVPPSAQVKLLRILQEKSFTRVGGTRAMASDFRLVAATNRDLARDVAEGRFRQDLYYRLNVVPLVLPPLRDRGDDIVLLAREFLGQYARKYHRVLPGLTKKDISALMTYPWPGNVRELKNVMERTAILSSADRLSLILPVSSGSSEEPSFSDNPTMDDLQRRYITHVLGLTGGRIGGPGGAAKILGMKRTTLQARMRKLGISWAILPDAPGT